MEFVLQNRILALFAIAVYSIFFAMSVGKYE